MSEVRIHLNLCRFCWEWDMLQISDMMAKRQEHIPTKWKTSSVSPLSLKNAYSKVLAQILETKSDTGLIISKRWADYETIMPKQTVGHVVTGSWSYSPIYPLTRPFIGGITLPITTRGSPSANYLGHNGTLLQGWTTVFEKDQL